ncbi:MAG: rhodanese-like domain-containing protein [Planctomycetota bacterium]|nr:rhodanese-like domain-containing protein [Planctomycetota bacterium]
MSEFPIEIDVHSVKALLDSGQEFVFLDIREPEEREMVKIEETTWIPMGEITTRVEELSESKSKRLVVYCHLGGRSLRVTHWLRANGFSEAQNMTGGIETWALEIDPSLPRY